MMAVVRLIALVFLGGLVLASNAAYIRVRVSTIPLTYDIVVLVVSGRGGNG